MGVIAVILGICFLLAILQIVRLKSELRRLTDEMKQSELANSNQKLRVEFQDRHMLKLVEAINQIYQQAQACRQESKAAIKELQDSISDLSHDLRTPLTSIIGFLQLAQRPGVSEEERKNYLEIALARADRLRIMIDTLFEMAKLESGQVTFVPERMALREALTETLAALYLSFAESGNEPQISLPVQPTYIYADPLSVRRVIENVLRNMLLHGERGFAITLAIQDKYAILRASNISEPFSEDDLKNIFKRNFVKDNSRYKQNSGLGLAITKALVTQNEGEIWAEYAQEHLTICIRWPLI